MAITNKKPVVRITFTVACSLLLAACSGGTALQRWHNEQLHEEFTEPDRDEIAGFEDYLALEERLFEELDEEIYSEVPTGTDQLLNRYSRGSLSDPNRLEINWNRSFELPGDGDGVLLLHGMSDSPYSLRAIGLALNQRGYHVLGLRSPGHGTTPSGLKKVHWRDMAAATGIAMEHLLASDKPVHAIGYSTGATLALNLTVEALKSGSTPPASLVLVSPAIRVSRAAAMAGFKGSLARVPGMGGMAWLSVMDEFDPYKYNSFATNAGAQVHRLTTDVDRRMRALDPALLVQFPPVLAFKSTVDATVTTEAIVDSLLNRLPEGHNELVLFDVNRQATVQTTALVSGSGPFTKRLIEAGDLPFTLRLVTNDDENSLSVSIFTKPPNTAGKGEPESLRTSWPRGVVSLSHVALPFPPDDPVYGQQPVDNRGLVFLGDVPIKGERGLYRIPPDWLARMRYNPFYDFMEARLVEWLEEASKGEARD